MCQSQTRPKCTENFDKIVLPLARSPKILDQAPGRKKDLAEGPQSHRIYGTVQDRFGSPKKSTTVTKHTKDIQLNFEIRKT